VRAELHRPDAHDAVVAIATWDGAQARLDLKDPSVPGLDRILRTTPIVTDDPSLRHPGTSGPVVLQPGDLEWFRAALLTRAPEIGLTVRFVSDSVVGGYDPASQYRSFEEQVERLSN
jgi:hypothetical protein